MNVKLPEDTKRTGPETKEERAQRTRAILEAQQRQQERDLADRARLAEQEQKTRERIRNDDLLIATDATPAEEGVSVGES